MFLMLVFNQIVWDVNFIPQPVCNVAPQDCDLWSRAAVDANAAPYARHPSIDSCVGANGDSLTLDDLHDYRPIA